MTIASFTPTYTVTDPLGALDDLDCMMERLGALLAGNNIDLNHDVIEAMPDDHIRSRAYSVWLIATLANEKFAEANEVLAAINAALRSSHKVSVA